MYKESVLYEEVYNFVEEIRKKNNLSKDIADVACGTGILLKIFKNSGYRVFGSDLNENMLNEAKQKLPQDDLDQISYDKVILPQKMPIIVSFFNFSHTVSIRNR